MHAAGHAALALIAAACASALAGGPGLLVPGSAGAAFDPPWARDPLTLAALGLVAVIAKGLGATWGAFVEARIGGDVGAALRLDALDGWLALHRTAHGAHKKMRAPRQRDQGVSHAARPLGTSPDARAVPTSALAAMTDHVREVEAGLGGAIGAFRAIAQIAPLAVALAWMAPRLALVAAVAFAAFGWGLGRARKAWKRANARAAAEREALVAAADEAVKHAELWTTYGAEGRVRSHVARVGRALATRGARIAASAAALSAANEVLGGIALLLAIAAARAGWIGAGEGALLPFAVTFFMAYRPIRDLTDARLAIARAAASADALGALVDAAASNDAREAHPARDDEARATTWGLERLVVRDLTLARGAALPVSLRVEPGAIVAIVGATGSGKTTLLRTLLGLEAARAGEVRYGAARIDAADAGLARPFAWVPQDAPLLADTLDANVALAPGASDPRGALDAIGAGALARDVDRATLGPGGRALSGGERQWVAIARAVATRQPVLLLDEPTSGLDRASQARVLDAIARLRGERSVILVTHREEPLAIADHVLRFDDLAAPSAPARLTGTCGPSS